MPRKVIEGEDSFVIEPDWDWIAKHGAGTPYVTAEALIEGAERDLESEGAPPMPEDGPRGEIGRFLGVRIVLTEEEGDDS